MFSVSSAAKVPFFTEWPKKKAKNHFPFHFITKTSKITNIAKRTKIYLHYGQDFITKTSKKTNIAKTLSPHENKNVPQK